MERANPNKAKKYKKIVYNSNYDRGITVINEKVVISEKVVFITDLQAKTLNSQYLNTGVKYSLIEEEKKSKGRPKKEETKTEE